MSVEWLKQLPKLDLHCHLDGSISAETIGYLLAEEGIKMPYEELQKSLQVTQECANLIEYLEKFDLPLKCLQTEKALKLAAIDLLKNAAAENIRYIEVRFAPMSHVARGLSCKKVIESVLEGIKEGQKQYPIQATLIVCAMRHYTMENNLKMLRSSREYLGAGVCALDLAGDEITYPTGKYEELFHTAKQLDMPFTIHSGECGSADNVRAAITFGAKRIGHGIAMEKDLSLMNFCREKRVGIEMCPTSNFQTKAVPSYQEYPLKLFLENGILATINTDNRTVSGTTVTKELTGVFNNIEPDEYFINKLQQNAVEITFADDTIKHRLLMEMGM
jgi:adenosine deaminase